MKLALLLIPLLFLSSCTSEWPKDNSSTAKPLVQKSYYDALSAECNRWDVYNQSGCNQSVEWMEKNGFREISVRLAIYCKDYPFVFPVSVRFPALERIDVCGHFFVAYCDRYRWRITDLQIFVVLQPRDDTLKRVGKTTIWIALVRAALVHSYW